MVVFDHGGLEGHAGPNTFGFQPDGVHGHLGLGVDVRDGVDDFIALAGEHLEVVGVLGEHEVANGLATGLSLKDESCKTHLTGRR